MENIEGESAMSGDSRVRVGKKLGDDGKRVELEEEGWVESVWSKGWLEGPCDDDELQDILSRCP